MASYDLGRVLRQTFGLMRASLPGAGVFLLVLSIAGQVANWGMQSALAADMKAAMGTGPLPSNASLAMFSSKWYWLTLLASMVIGALSYAGALAGLLQQAQGRKASLAGCFSAGFAKLAPMLGLTLLWWIAVMFGLILLVIPGILLMVMWAVAMPALVVEDSGVIDAFNRSRDLTRNNRLLVFATLLIAVLLIYVPLFLLGGAAMANGAAQLEAIRSGQVSILMVAVTAIYGWLVALFISAILAAMYRELVRIKEGGTSTELQDVFE